MKRPRDSSQMAPPSQGPAEHLYVWHTGNDKQKRSETWHNDTPCSPSDPLQGEVFAFCSGTPGELLESLNHQGVTRAEHAFRTGGVRRAANQEKGGVPCALRLPVKDLGVTPGDEVDLMIRER